MRAPHIYIVGQTASGKTALALDFAEKHSLEILNTDSLLFYKDLNIGTAKPSNEEFNLVKHHFVNICELGEELTASAYEKQASVALEKSKRPMLCVGGSGFYIKALDSGLLPLPETDPTIKAQVLKMEGSVERLKEVDPEIFEKISEKDLYRVGRALEVYLQTGKPLSVWQKEFSPQPLAKKLAFHMNREDLRKRVKTRTKEMLKKGFVFEVEELLKKEVLKKPWKPLQSVGYQQVVDFLQGKIKTAALLEEEIVLRTMQLSKRQKTWFQKDKTVTWFDVKDYKKAYGFLNQVFKETAWRV